MRRDVVAALRVAEKMLGAVGEPLHRPAEAPRRLEAQRVFPVHEGLGAEAAADIAGLHVEGVRRHLEDRLRQRVAQAVHALAADGEREALAVPFGRGSRASP